MEVFLSKLLDNQASSILMVFNSIGILLTLISFAVARDNLIKIFSLSVLSALVCLLYLFLDAPDVAMTEAAIGACLSTVILLIFAQKIPVLKSENKISIIRHISAIFSCAIIFIVFGKLSALIPVLGLDNSPVNVGVSDYYVKNTPAEIGIPAFVAAILASYRGFDTLGETVVILVAGISVALILGMKYERK